MMTTRLEDGGALPRRVGIFLMRWGGALALAWLAVTTGARVLGWTIGLEGITTTAGEVAALRRSVAGTGIRVDTLVTQVQALADTTRGHRLELQAQIDALRAEIIPALNAQSRYLCFKDEPVASLADVPCSDLRRRRGPAGPRPSP